MRDSQRSKVYAWERTTFSNHDIEELSLDECEALVKDIWRAYRPGSLPPVVKDGRGTKIARANIEHINLPLWARNRIVICHEVAHSLLPDHEVHGPRFLRLEIELLNRFGMTGKTKSEIISSARAAKLKVGGLRGNPIPQQRTRRRKLKV